MSTTEELGLSYKILGHYAAMKIQNRNMDIQTYGHSRNYRRMFTPMTGRADVMWSWLD